ncbi:MAG: helix-turn-helix transcriptional regulator [Deltaproteobacteria bacterium]|nr:helix-turn-helix transcriptional regulator [Deltaproteobacteria bacterium]
MPLQDSAEVLRDVGRRIAELRAARGHTQEAFAERLRVTVQYEQRVEAGRENLTVQSLVKLAGELGVLVADLFAAPAVRTRRPGRPRSKPAADALLAAEPAGPERTQLRGRDRKPRRS